jgi:hypothetical protein
VGETAEGTTVAAVAMEEETVAAVVDVAEMFTVKEGAVGETAVAAVAMEEDCGGSYRGGDRGGDRSGEGDRGGNHSSKEDRGGNRSGVAIEEDYGSGYGGDCYRRDCRGGDCGYRSAKICTAPVTNVSSICSTVLAFVCPSLTAVLNFVRFSQMPDWETSYSP